MSGRHGTAGDKAIRAWIRLAASTRAGERTADPLLLPVARPAVPPAVRVDVGVLIVERMPANAVRLLRVPVSTTPRVFRRRHQLHVVGVLAGTVPTWTSFARAFLHGAGVAEVVDLQSLGNRTIEQKPSELVGAYVPTLDVQSAIAIVVAPPCPYVAAVVRVSELHLLSPAKGNGATPLPPREPLGERELVVRHDPTAYREI
jgi:hypothetical protein